METDPATIFFYTVFGAFYLCIILSVIAAIVKQYKKKHPKWHKYRNLINPSIPFLKYDMINLFDELIDNFHSYETHLRNIPHDMFDHVKWNIFKVLGYVHTHAADVEFYKDGVLVYILNIKLSRPMGREWLEGYNHGEEVKGYPLEIHVTDEFKKDKMHWYMHNTYTYSLKNPEWAAVTIGLLSGFLTAGVKLLYPDAGVRYEVYQPITTVEPGYDETDTASDN